jgi:serine protease Do
MPVCFAGIGNLRIDVKFPIILSEGGGQMKAFHTWLPLLALGLFVLASLACSSVFTVGTQPTSVPAPAASAAVATYLAATPAPVAVATSQPAATPVPVTLLANDFSSAVHLVAQRVRPAVVQITNEQVQLDQFNQPFAVPAGVGSGVIYDSQGHILTNDHVVAGAQKLVVSLPDGRSFQAKLVGGDPQTDLAVVQINAPNLPIAELGNSNQLQVGDWVVAIGNALALRGGPTVTAGVVSALGRTVQEPSSSGGSGGPFLYDVIQTSAPINPGNSGGPLVNLAGQVVGINTLVAGQAEPGVQAQGIGFAIAINTVKPIADQLVATGRVIHPYLGIRYVPLNPAIAAQLGIEQTEGILVASVANRSPASQAGLQPNDIITAIDNTPLTTDSALDQIVNSHKPGDILTLSVLRGTQKLSLKVTLGESPS